MSTTTCRHAKSKTVKDCIYRFVRIPVLCRAFLDTPEVQRLRRVAQLGVVQHLYPSATHTRFEHSLGVMHLAGVMIDCLRENAGVEVDDRTKHLVQLAGLLHDSGHLAFSHVADAVDPNAEPHESRSCKVLREVNARLVSRNPAASPPGIALSAEELDMVEAMILGQVPEEARRAGRAFLFQIVSNSRCGLDVDRMDYLQRDAHHTGLPSFQPDYILQSAIVDPETGELAFRSKCRADVEDLFRTRLRMFGAVYRHPKVLAIERLFVCAMRGLGVRAPADMPWSEFQKSCDGAIDAKLRESEPELMALIDSRDTSAHPPDCQRCLGVERDKSFSSPFPPGTDSFESAARKEDESVHDQMARVLWISGKRKRTHA